MKYNRFNKPVLNFDDKDFISSKMHQCFTSLHSIVLALFQASEDRKLFLNFGFIKIISCKNKMLIRSNVLSYITLGFT